MTASIWVSKFCVIKLAFVALGAGKEAEVDDGFALPVTVVPCVAGAFAIGCGFRLAPDEGAVGLVAFGVGATLNSLALFCGCKSSIASRFSDGVGLAAETNGSV